MLKVSFGVSTEAGYFLERRIYLSGWKPSSRTYTGVYSSEKARVYEKHAMRKVQKGRKQRVFWGKESSPQGE